MTDCPQPPRPSTELLPENLRLSPKQREVLETVMQYADGAKAAEVAEQLGMHVNTARGHLDELVRKKALITETAEANGRGRPHLIFHARTPRAETIANEYVALIELLSARLGDDDDDAAHEIAYNIGITWAKNSGSESTFDDLLFHLRAMGFDPTRINPSTIGLYACPFVGASHRWPSMVICTMHAGYLQETLGENQALRVIPKSAENECLVLSAPAEATDQPNEPAQ